MSPQPKTHVIRIGSLDPTPVYRSICNRLLRDGARWDDVLEVRRAGRIIRTVLLSAIKSDASNSIAEAAE